MNELERFAAFNSGLASLLRSGLPLDGALESLARELRWGRFRGAVERVEASVRMGTPLSDAVAEERAFPPYYAALVKAGEEGGDLPELLLQAAREARASAEVSRRLWVTLLYPALVVACLFGMTSFFGYYAGHIVSKMIEPMYGGLSPPATRALLDVTGVMPWVGFAGLGAMAGIILYTYLARAFGLPRLTLALFGWLPPVKAGEVARFAGTLGLLTSSGVKLRTALELVAEMMRVPAFRYACIRAAHHVADGESLASALKQERCFPYFFSWAVGAEEGGPGFDEVLREMARLYRERARRSGELLALLVAPAAVVVAGLLVGLFVLTVFAPLINMFQGIG